MLKLMKTLLISVALVLACAVFSQAYATDSAKFISQSVPAVMNADQSYSVSITMKNNGTSTWRASRNYKLGSLYPKNNMTWGLNRVLLSSTDAIIPGQSKTFTFSVKAPSTPGTYNFQWKMLREGVAWFGAATLNVAITVNKKQFMLLKDVSGMDETGKYVGTKFFKDNVNFFSATGGADNRGINLAVLHPVTGEIEDIQNFDNWYNGSLACDALNKYIDMVPDGRVIMTSIADHGSYITEATYQKFESLGSRYIRDLSTWDGWAMILKKGTGSVIAEKSAEHDTVGGEPPCVIESSVNFLGTADHAAPIGSFSINSGAVSTNNPEVTLNLSSVTDIGSGMAGGAKMSFSNDGTNWTAPEYFSSAKKWYLNRGNGTKTVYAKFADKDGNWNTAPLSSQIVLNETARLAELSQLASIYYSSFDFVKDKNNNLFAVWEGMRPTDSATKVFLAVSRDKGQTWQLKVLANSASYGYSFPTVSCDDSGHVYAAWSDSYKSIYLNVSKDYGQTWMITPVKLSAIPPTSVNLCYPRVKCDNMGNVYVAWVYKDSSTYKSDLYLNRSTNFGLSWLPSAVKVNRGTEVSYWDNTAPNLECDSQNNVYLVWAGKITGESYYKVYGNFSYDRGATWQAADIAISKGYTSDSGEQIGLCNNKLLVSWITRGGRSGEGEVYFQRSEDKGLSWLTSDIKVGDNHYTFPNYRKIAYGEKPLEMKSDAAGNIYIAWTEMFGWQRYPERHDIYFSCSRNFGSTWLSTSLRINTSDPAVSNAYRPSLACNDNGGVCLVYLDDRNYISDKPILYRNLSLKGNVYMNYSKDFGATWLSNDIRMNREYKAVKDSQLATANPEAIYAADGSIFSIWLEGLYWASNKSVNLEIRNTNP